MGNEALVLAGIELVKILLNGAFAMAKTLNVPDDKLDEAFAAAKAEFLKNDPENFKFGE